MLKLNPNIVSILDIGKIQLRLQKYSMGFRLQRRTKLQEGSESRFRSQSGNKLE
jgi:hypothetical protein